MSAEPSFGDYLREAFNVRVKVPGLGGLPLNWMAIAGIGTLGLANPGFWLLGAGAELFFVMSLAHHPRFRAHVRRTRAAAARRSESSDFASREAHLLGKLGDPSRERYQALVARCGRVRELGGDDDTGVVGELAEEGLSRLQWIFLRLLASRELLARQVDPRAARALRAELQEAQDALTGSDASENDKVRRSRQATVEVLQRRIRNLEDVDAHLTYIDSELRRIEHQAEALIEEAALAKDPDDLTRRIDAVAATFDDAQEWMRLNKESLVDVEDELARPIPARVTQ